MAKFDLTRKPTVINFFINTNTSANPASECRIKNNSVIFPGTSYRFAQGRNICIILQRDNSVGQIAKPFPDVETSPSLNMIRSPNFSSVTIHWSTESNTDCVEVAKLCQSF